MFEDLEQLLNKVAAHTSLGHAKRNQAFLRQVENLCRSPGGTGAGANRSMTDTISAYRFAANKAIDLSALRESRLATTLDTCPEDETLLVINDVSILDYYHHDSKSDRRRVGDDKGKGYEYVCNLGVALESERPVGVLHDCLIHAEGPDDKNQIAYHDDPQFKKISDADPDRLECNHKHILNAHLKHIAARASERPIIEVADREFDDHFIFETCARKNVDLVIRSCAQRNVQVHADVDWLPEKCQTQKYPGLPRLPDHLCSSMKSLVEHVPTTPYKAIALDARGRLTDPNSAKSHINVSIGAFSVTLYRKVKRNQTYLNPQDYIPLNVVVIKEDDPPSDRAPIQWVLFTTLPVTTLEEMKKVARIYELRWLIECFFKYLKSGFKLEDLRYDNAQKIAIHIISITIATTYLINLKSSLSLPCSGSNLTLEDYTRIKQAAANPTDENIPPDLRIFALMAIQGGWRGRKNDPISPMTLLKGFRSLTDAIDLIEQAGPLIQYASLALERKYVYNR